MSFKCHLPQRPSLAVAKIAISQSLFTSCPALVLIVSSIDIKCINVLKNVSMTTAASLIRVSNDNKNTMPYDEIILVLLHLAWVIWFTVTSLSLDQSATICNSILFLHYKEKHILTDSSILIKTLLHSSYLHLTTRHKLQSLLSHMMHILICTFKYINGTKSTSTPFLMVIRNFRKSL